MKLTCSIAAGQSGILHICVVDKLVFITEDINCIETDCEFKTHRQCQEKQQIKYDYQDENNQKFTNNAKNAEAAPNICYPVDEPL